jgi:hypothetical protein
MSLFRLLASIYPDRFRRRFAGEILEILTQKLEAATVVGGAAILDSIFHESVALMTSIIKEHWHERQNHQEMKMVGEVKLDNEIKKIFLKRRLKSTGKVTLVLLTIILLLNGCSYACAGIHIAQARHWGVYPTLDEAVYGVHSIEDGNAKVIRIDINHSEPCFSSGDYPFVMCVTSTTFYDNIPEGYHHSKFSGQSAYFHLNDGWVLMPEGNTRFTAKVVELLGMQATGE